MGKSKWFCPTAKPQPHHILKKDFKIFLRLTAMASRLNPNKCKRDAYINSFAISENIPHIYYYARQPLNRRTLLRNLNCGRVDRHIYPSL